MRFACCAAIVVLAVFGFTLTGALAQTVDKDAVKQALEVLVVHLDECETDGVESLVSKNIEVFLNSYALRLDGWDALKEHIEGQQGSPQEVRTMVRQPSVRIIGTVAVVNFYYSQDSALAQEAHGGRGEDVAESPTGPERVCELGRGTVVFVQGKEKGWKALSVHLSPMPEQEL